MNIDIRLGETKSEEKERSGGDFEHGNISSGENVAVDDLIRRFEIKINHEEFIYTENEAQPKSSEVNVEIKEDDEIDPNSNLESCLSSDSIEKVAISFLTQEPWPKDVKLYQPYEVEQILLPDNANCLAVQAFLKMCQLDFKVESRANAEAMSPSGKVPFIKAGAFVVSELDGIVQFVNNKGISLTEKFDAEMKSNVRAYLSLIPNVLEIAELYICWLDKETYNEVTSVRNGSIYPWPLNHIQNYIKRNQVYQKLKVLKWHNKKMEDVLQEVDTCCKSLSERLDDKQYFFGESPTELDALVFGHLFTILTTPLPKSDLADIVRNYPQLINLVDRIEKKYFKRDH